MQINEKMAEVDTLEPQLTTPQLHNSNGAIYLDSSLSSQLALRSCLRLQERPPGLNKVVFFDLDNTLYSKRTGIAEEMGHRIQLYFQEFLHLPEAESAELGRKYYLDYGLAIRGAIHNFGINAAEYDSFVDGGLQLEKVLHRDEALIELLKGLKARLWIFTNAGLAHALRVMRLLQIEMFFEGIVYCDYSEPNFPAKPDRLAYERAMRCADASPQNCYFVDDSVANVQTARDLGWTAVHLDERRDETGDVVPQIANLRDLQMDEKFAELFK
jgi:pyrimidine and pyridine-specific 5'-nucleotidase